MGSVHLYSLLCLFVHNNLVPGEEGGGDHEHANQREEQLQEARQSSQILHAKEPESASSKYRPTPR